MTIDNALRAATDTKALLVGDGAIGQVAKMFGDQFPGRKAIIVADDNTWRVAGLQVHALLQRGGVQQDEPYIFHDQDLYAEWTFVERLKAVLQGTDAIPVAVGSGTINDLCKLTSHLTGRRYMSVGTAASMDGYTSYGASITKDGAKQTFSCPAPQAWLGDTSIICQAPEQMTAAGYADLFAKIVAGADWILSDELGIEPIDANVWSIVQDSLPHALAHPQAIHDRDPKAIGELVEGLILSGFTMQAHRSSRPASGADHQFSHLWNMEHHTNHGQHVSHGFQVSIGTLCSCALYECALSTDLTKIDVDRCVAAWPTAQALKEEALHMFQGTDFPTIGAVETASKYVDAQGLRQQLEQLAACWPHLKERLQHQLIPFDEMKQRLSLVGAPTEPGQIGVSRDYLRRSYVRAQYIRRRFTILDLAVRTGNMQPWLNRLFGHGGRWEAK